MTTAPVDDPADGPSATPSMPQLGGRVGHRGGVPHAASGASGPIQSPRLAGWSTVPAVPHPVAQGDRDRLLTLEARGSRGDSVDPDEIVTAARKDLTAKAGRRPFA
jgi:hypothetical protein